MKRIFRSFRRCLSLLICTLMLHQANAQSCGCDFTLTPTDGIWQFDGATAGVQPGDTICMTGTRAAGIIFKNLHGTPQHPVVITNACNGKVIINHGGWADVFTVLRSSYVHISGARNPSEPYGIEIRGGSMAMQLRDLTTNIEVDHVKIDGPGCVGIVAKTDPTCDPATWRANFTMRNVKLHHNYLNNTGCEGFYIGNSHYDYGRELVCNGNTVVIDEHGIDTVEVYNNLLDGIGQDGIQVGGATHTVIHDNTIKHWARNGIEQHANGIQVGSGTTQAIVYNNKLDSGGYCFADWGGGGKWFNNVARDGRRGAFILSDDPVAYAPTGYTIVNNTVVNYGGYGIDLYASNPASPSIMKNNILAGRTTQTGYVFLRGSTASYTDSSNNYKTTNPANVKFVDTATGDYHLQSTSPAVNAGMNASSYGVTVDFDGVSRPQGAAYDIGAYERTGTPPVDTPTVTSKFNFTFTSQFVNGWTSVDGSPHAAVASGTDFNTGFSVSSISTAQWNPSNTTPPRSSFNGGTTNGTVQPPEVVVTNWFNYNAPYGATVNGVVQGDNIALTGLAPNTVYSLHIGASRRTAGGGNADEYGTMEYRFNGTNPQTLLVTDNRTAEVVVNATSNASGRIGISARKVNGSSMNYGYIGWLTVTGHASSAGSRVGILPRVDITETLPAGKQGLLLYPNPASNSAVLNLSGYKDQAVEISILSTLGELLQQRSVKGGSYYTMNTTALQNGIYFVRVKSNEKSVTTRLVISK